MSENIKLLPLLIVVAMLAFSVRFADVTEGVSAIGGVAQAEEKPSEDELKEPESEEKMEEGMADSKEKMGKEAKDELEDDKKKPVKMAKKDKKEDIGEKWRSATDQDLEYQSVEKEMFEDIVNRRKTLDKQESNLNTREALLRAAEQELDRKYQELNALRTELKGLLEQQSEEEQQRINDLVKLYEGMKPKDAARIFDTLDLDILVTLMGRMSPRKLSPVLAAMNAERARTVTILLAEQKQLPSLP